MQEEGKAENAGGEGGALRERRVDQDEAQKFSNLKQNTFMGIPKKFRRNAKNQERGRCTKKLQGACIIRKKDRD